MSFAIFYNQSDLQLLADYIGNPLSFIASQRAEADAYMAGGLSNWAGAPDASAANGGPPDGDAKLMVISGTFNGQALTLARFIEICRGVAARGGNVPNSYGGGPEYLNALADDMVNSGVENWQG